MLNRYYGQHNPPVDEVLHKNYFEDVRNGFFVDCGASEGVLHSCTKFFEDSLNWGGICIEPSPEAFKELSKNRKALNLNIGLSNSNGQMTFTHATNPKGSAAGLPAGGSIKYPDELRRFVSSFGYKFEDILIDVITYDHLVDEFGIESVDLMVIDVEGYELSVIGGMSKCLPKVMCAEYPFSGLDKIREALSKLGYRFDFTSYNNAFFSIGFPLKSWFGANDG